MNRKKYTFTVIIPAHNEEKYVARCIGSVKSAAKFYGGSVQIIVVCNRCTDATAEIAKKLGAAVHLYALKDTLFRCYATICFAVYPLVLQSFIAVYSGLKNQPSWQ